MLKCETMSLIEVSDLKKYYRVHQKEPGLRGSLNSLLHRRYYDARAVDDVSFNINEGELVGFIGPNGAGKTTTLKCLSGLLHPTEGWVSVLGEDPQKRSRNFLQQIALVMGQKNQLWWDLPPMETFLLNKEIYQVEESQFQNTLKELTALLSVSDLINVPVRKLSLGERMKCELIASLLHSPKVLFLDEPTIGLDVVMQKTMRDFIEVYNRKFRATIMLTSHYMDDVKELCKRVIIIDKGRLLYDGDLSQIVRRFAPQKILSVIFSSHVDVRDVGKIGEIKEFSFPNAQILVDREKTSAKAALLLKKFDVEDLTIEEIPIEEIIRKVFTDKMK